MSRVGTCDIGAFESRGFTLTKSGGDGQSTTVRTPFTTPLAVTVSSGFSEPVNGGQVTFIAPSSGASTNPAVNTATIASGAVSQSVTANGTAGGPYTVTASAAGATSVNFSLTNLTSAVNADLAVAQSYQLNFLHDITFTLTVRNLGPNAAPNAVVSDTFPAGSTTWNWSCVSSGGATCTASGSATFTIRWPASPAAGRSPTLCAATWLTGPAGSIRSRLSRPPGSLMSHQAITVQL